MPLSSLVKDIKFTLEIDVTREEGVPQATLENKIKEDHSANWRVGEGRKIGVRKGL